MKKGHLRFSMLCWLNRNRSKKGKPAIYLRICVDGKRTEISTYQYIDPLLWDQAAQKVKGSSEEAASINRQLTTMKGDIQRHYSLLVSTGQPVSVQAVRNAYQGVAETGKSLCEAFLFHNKRFADKVKAGTKSADTLKHHEVTRKKVETFIKWRYRVADKPLKEVSFSLAPHFEHYLTTVDGISSNTAMKHVKVLKQVLKMAVEQGWLPNNPLGNFKCTYEEPERERLTMDEVMALYRKELHPRLAEVRDIYLFCCFTGFAFADVAQLTPGHVVIGIDGEKWISKAREKTQSRENVPLLPIAL